MPIKNIQFNSFKPYSHYLKNEENNFKKNMPNPKALVGAAAGVLCGMKVAPVLIKKGKIKEGTLKEVIEMLSMAGLANVFSVLFASFKNDNKKENSKKWREAGFQFMNTSIPMLMVSVVHEVCKRCNSLNNKPVKIIGSILGMLGGAMIATKLSNLSAENDSQIRKYSLKDSIANFDDIAATIIIGFPQYQKLNKYAKILLPYIYTYCGTRAGSKE